MKNVKLKELTLAGVFTALIFVFTAYVHIPAYNGYVHIGDAFIYLAASLLPGPYAVFSGVLGAALADCLTGFAPWAPGTAVIKALTVIFFTPEAENLLAKRNLLALFPSAVLCVGGYYAYEGILYGNFASAVYGIPGNIAQAVFSSALFAAASLALDRCKVKERLRATGMIHR